MPIIVNSPYSGQPVKVRDQDVNRALRDEEGRIFYAVPRSDGQGYYGSPTRGGSPKDEQRAEELAQKMTRAHASGAEQTQRQLHDATGRRRARGRHYLVVLLIFAAVAVGVWYFFFHTPQGAGIREQGPGLPEGEPAPAAPQPEPAGDPAAPAAAASAWITTASGLRYRIDAPGHASPPAAAGQFVRIHFVTTDGSMADGLSPSATGAAKREEQTRPPRAGANLAPRVAGRSPSAIRNPSSAIGPSTSSGVVGFVLWSGQAIRAWDEGLTGMREGEVRTLIAPPHLLTSGLPGDLPASAVRFEVTMLEVLPGVTRQVLSPGVGRTAQPGDTVEMHYVVSLAGVDRPCDDSYARRAPLRFRLGAGRVIPGWELGVTGMTEGEKRRLTIPPYLAYGARGAGRLIPPDATLDVEVELLRIVSDEHADAPPAVASLPRVGE